MAKKLGRPFWFKLDMSVKPLIDAIPDENAGRAIKAALEYFETREPITAGDSDPLTLAAFLAMKGSVDNAYSEYEQRIENGKKGGKPSEKPPSADNHMVTTTNHMVTEKEEEKEADKEKDEDISLEGEDSFLASLPFFQKSDSMEIRRERLASVGLGLVIITDEQLKELYEKLSLVDFEHYVGVVRDCVNKGRKYTRKTHAQAILDMARADGKIITAREQSSFDLDDFFEASLRRSFEKQEKLFGKEKI